MNGQNKGLHTDTKIPSWREAKQRWKEIRINDHMQCTSVNHSRSIYDNWCESFSESQCQYENISFLIHILETHQRDAATWIITIEGIEGKWYTNKKGVDIDWEIHWHGYRVQISKHGDLDDSITDI